MTQCITVADWGGDRIFTHNPDDTVSIADLSVFCLFDADAHGSNGDLAYEAIIAAYTDERIFAEYDHYDGWWITFADHSVLRFRKPG